MILLTARVAADKLVRLDGVMACVWPTSDFEMQMPIIAPWLLWLWKCRLITVSSFIYLWLLQDRIKLTSIEKCEFPFIVLGKETRCSQMHLEPLKKSCRSRAQSNYLTPH